VLGAWWIAGQAVGGAAGLAIGYSKATGGHVYLVELLLAAFGLWFFIASGFLIGAAISSWYAPGVALVWSLIWVAVLPVYYSVLFPDSGTNLEYLLFPALASSNHRPLLAGPVVAVVGWWMVVAAGFTFVIVAWYRRQARRSGWPLAASAAALLGTFFAGVNLPVAVGTPFYDQVEAMTCASHKGLEYCVLDEEAPLLDEMVKRAKPAIARVGAALPDDVLAVASSAAVPALADERGLETRQILAVNLSPRAGAPEAGLDIGTSLAGLGSCAPGTSDDIAVAWAFSLGAWIAEDSTARPIEETMFGPNLAAVSDEAVLSWYAKHSDELRACRYAGPGPQG
jgi:hypothetical protein